MGVANSPLFSARSGISYAISALLIVAASIALLGVVVAFVMPQIQGQSRNPKLEVSVEIVKVDGGSLMRITAMNPGSVPLNINWGGVVVKCPSQISCSVQGSCPGTLKPGQTAECIYKCGNVDLLNKCVITLKGSDPSGKGVAAVAWTIVRE